MALQNFVDRVGPVLSADWLNQVDVDLNARLTSKQVGMSSSKSASYNRGALQDAVDSGLGRLDIVTDYAGETFLIDDAIDVPNGMEIQGINRWGCNISSTALATPIFRFGNTNTKNALRGLHLSYSGTPLAGATAIESNGSTDLDLYRMTISSCWTGVHLLNGGYHELVGLRVFSYENCGLLVDGAIDVNLSVFRMSAYARPGMLGGIRLIGGVEAFTASQGDITLGTYGMTADTNGGGTRGNSPFYNRFSKVFFDSPLYNPAYLRYAQHIDFESCWFASAGHDAADTGYTALTDHAGIDMENCQHIRFLGGDCYGNGGNGVNHYAANKHITYHGMGFKRNGRWRSAARAGINVLAGATDFSVHGCPFEEDADTAEFRQSIAVNVNAGASDRYSITGNTLGGCSIVDGGTGTDREVVSNVGNGGAQKIVYLTDPRFGYVSGAADSTTAVQAAITAAYNGTLEMPGELVYASTLTIADNIHIRWPEAANSILKQVAGTNANFVTVAYTVVVNPILENVTIDGNKAGNATGHALYLPDHAEPDPAVTYGFAVTLINSYVINGAEKSMYVGVNRNFGRLKACEIKRGDTGCFYMTGSSDWQSEFTAFAYPISGCALEVVSGAANTFIGGAAYGAVDAPAVRITNTSSSPTLIHGMTINSNQMEAVHLIGANGLGRHLPNQIKGCFFADNGLATDNTYAHIKLTDTSGAIIEGNSFRWLGTGNRAKYLVEFAGAAGISEFTANSWDAVTNVTFGTAVSNTLANLVTKVQNLTALGTVTTGGTLATSDTANQDFRVGSTLVRAARMMYVASGTNYLDIYPAINGSPVQLAAGGSSDTDVDIRLAPKGSGVVRFGTHAGLAAETVSGYIEIKDAGGTVRKLAVVS